MATGKFTPIEQIPPELDPKQSCVVVNPLPTDFSHNYGGEKITLIAGKSNILSKPAAFHMAKHLAQKIAYENLFDELQKQYKDHDDINMWKKQTDKRVKKETLIGIINLLVKELTSVEGAEKIVKAMKARLAKSSTIDKAKNREEDKLDAEDEDEIDETLEEAKKDGKPATDDSETPPSEDEEDEDVDDEDEEDEEVNDDEEEAPADDEQDDEEEDEPEPTPPAKTAKPKSKNKKTATKSKK
jgi:hypothetical protein